MAVSLYIPANSIDRFPLLHTLSSVYSLWIFFYYGTRFLRKCPYVIYLIFGCPGPCCWAWAFSGCSEQGLLFIEVCRLLIAMASLVAEHRLWAAQASVVGACGLSCSETCRIFPNLGIKPVSPALAGRFLSTGQPGRPEVLG